MATITPTSTVNGEVRTINWTGVTTSTDTPTAVGPFNKGQGLNRASVLFAGTFGGATAVLHGSIDGTTYGPLYDIGGNAISATAAKVQDFTSSMLYFKPVVTGGTGDNVDITIVARS